MIEDLKPVDVEPFLKEYILKHGTCPNFEAKK